MHSEPWAYAAQRFIRDSRPRKPPRYLLVGTDEAGELGAASRFQEEASGTFFMLEVLAVALRLRGHRIGDEAMNQTVDFITQLSLVRGITSVTLQGNVDRHNAPSLGMLERWGFRYQWDMDDRYLTYAAEIFIGHAAPQ